MSANDKELLELAAKAADLWDLLEETEDGFEFIGSYEIWNPLDSDGDALRLAVKLGMLMYIWQPNDGIGVHYTEINRNIKEKHGSDSCAATRRAIVRAAAKIGRMV